MTRNILIFFGGSLGTDGLVVNASRSESSPVERHWFDSGRMLKLSVAPWPFCVALSPSVH